MPEKHMIQCAKVQRRVRQQGRSQGKMTHSRVWDPIPVRQFVHEREQTMRKMDRSVKGSIDSPIVELVELINNTTDFYTTSSCSGRVIVTGTLPEVSETQKKNLQWLYSTHELIVDSEQLIEELEKQCIENTNDRFEFDKVVFKLEPFIVHIRCRSLEAGQRFLQLALDSGFRNSGLVISGSGRITLAVRSTLALEVPLVIDHTFVSSRQYLRKLVSVANQKMVQNKKMIDRIYHNLISSRI